MKKLTEYLEKMKEFVDQQSIDVFKTFLQARGLEDRFNKNLVIRNVMNIDDSRDLFSNGFIWSNSPEGFCFWSAEEDQWLEELSISKIT